MIREQTTSRIGNRGSSIHENWTMGLATQIISSLEEWYIVGSILPKGLLLLNQANFVFTSSPRSFNAMSKSSEHSQVSKLRPPTHVITTNDQLTSKAVILKRRPATWTTYDGDQMAFDVIYTTSQFPTSLNELQDMAAHDAVMASGALGLVRPDGTVCRVVDFAPGYQTMMHRTQSLDYGIVIEGSVILILDSGEEQTLGRGDTVVQRGTNHAWRNPSTTEWARMVFTLQSSQPIVVNGRTLSEDLGSGTTGIPASGS